MDVRAMVLVGGRDTVAPNASAKTETVGGIPIAYLDVLGLPVLQRVLQRLERFGIADATLIGHVSAEAEHYLRPSSMRPHAAWIEACGEEVWNRADETFSRYAENGADLVLVVRVGPYAEVDYEELVQHHLDHRCPVTMAADSAGASLDIFVLDASRRHDASALFRSQLKKLRTDCASFRVSGYSNRLQNPADLRRLAVDGLLQKNSIRPSGAEIKPGIWVGKAARIHGKARVVAPAFIGAHANIRAASLITRNTAVEHHAIIDCGSVVENSTVLPYTYVGAGLDVMHSVVGLRRLSHLMRNVDVEISDHKIVGMSPFSAVSRMAGSAAALFAFLPKQIYRGIFATSHRKTAANCPESLEQQAAALKTPVLEAEETGSEASEFPSTLAVARRYGEQ